MQRERGVAAAGFDRWDLCCLALFVVLWYALLVFRYDALPLQAWDESRQAVTSYEMATGHGWLAPTYEGAPDHYNTKPPLLVWSIAALMRLGLPLVLAIRLPVFLAVLSTVVLVWAVGRFGLRDRAAGVIAALLLFSSQLYFGIHVGRTGDFDALLSLFAACGVFAFWLAVWRAGPVRLGWFAGFAAALVLAVMTKGIAGLFAPVGLFVFAAVTGRLGKLLLDYRVWLITLGALALCFGYYFTRELYDPGYLKGVWDWELGGRFAQVNEGHAEPVWFYGKVLVFGYGPGLVLLAAGLAACFGPEARRRVLARACLVCAAVIFCVITASKSKLFWYAAPIIPLLATATAIGVSDLARWQAGRRIGAIAVGVLLLAAAGLVFVRNQRADIYIANAEQNGQYWYGQMFDRLERELVHRVVVPDGGLRYQGGPPDYNALLRFYAEVARDHGLEVVTVKADAAPAPNEVTASCDPEVVRRLLDVPGFAVSLRDKWCVAGRPAAPS